MASKFCIYAYLILKFTAKEKKCFNFFLTFINKICGNIEIFDKDLTYIPRDLCCINAKNEKHIVLNVKNGLSFQPNLPGLQICKFNTSAIFRQ